MSLGSACRITLPGYALGAPGNPLDAAFTACDEFDGGGAGVYGAADAIPKHISESAAHLAVLPSGSHAGRQQITSNVCKKK